MYQLNTIQKRQTFKFNIDCQTWQVLKPCWQQSYVLHVDDGTISKVDRLHHNLTQGKTSFLSCNT